MSNFKKSGIFGNILGSALGSAGGQYFGGDAGRGTGAAIGGALGNLLPFSRGTGRVPSQIMRAFGRGGGVGKDPMPTYQRGGRVKKHKKHSKK
jgi:hypothetical protein